jgi:hypothetical protein
MEYDTLTMLDYQYVVSPIDIFNRFQSEIEHMEKVLNTPKLNKNIASHKISQMARYKQEAINICYFLRSGESPVMGEMQHFLRSFRQLAKADSRFDVYVGILERHSQKS